MTSRQPIARAGMMAFLLILTPTVVQADMTWILSVDTSQLVGKTGTFSLDFQLASGDGTGASGNRATLTNFEFGLGSATPGGTTTFGDVTGSLTMPPLTLKEDQGGFSEFIGDFVPGNRLQFSLDLTSNLSSDPDTFAFAILHDGLNISTANPDGSDSFVEFNLTSIPTVTTWASDDSTYLISAPTVIASSVPGPSSWIMMLSGLVATWRLRRCPLIFSGRPLA